MKRNIDLTTNGDFQPIPSLRKNALKNVSNRLPNMEIKKDNIITDSECHTNFLTGSLNSIKKRSTKLKFIRDIENIECRCARCGGYLFDKQDTLCNKCDIKLMEEIRDEEVLSLFNINMGRVQ